MQRHIFVVMASAVAGREAELEAWYDKQHFPDWSRVKGFISARRHRIEELTAVAGSPEWTLMLVYEIESDDIKATFSEVRKRMGTSEMPLTDAIDKTTATRIIGVEVSRLDHRVTEGN